MSAGQVVTNGVTEPRSPSSDRCNAGVPNVTQARLDEMNVKNGKESDKPLNGVVESEPEKPGRNWEELINNARWKYSMERVGNPAPVLREPACADGVYPRWRLTKAEFGVPTSMAITSKGCVVVAEYGLSLVEFYDESGALTHNMEGLKPFCVIVNDKDQVKLTTIVINKLV